MMKLKILSLFPDKIEFSFLVTLLIGFVSLVGANYYDSYFSYFNVPYSEIDLDFIDHFYVFLMFSVIVISIYLPIHMSQGGNPQHRLEIIFQNIPMFVFSIMLTYVLLNFYWDNVMTLSSIMQSSSIGAEIDIERATESVNKGLKTIVLVFPVILATVIVGYCALKRKPLPKLLMEKSNYKIIFIIEYSISTSC